jgi:4-amino-4-deoxy-L-arabinose transferase-like glycosyltransferase
VVVAGTAVRLAWAIYAARAPVGLHDPVFYRLLSDGLAHGHGYSYPPPFNGPGVGFAPTAYYPPMYPALLSVLRWITLHTPLPDGATAPVVVLNLVAAAASIVLVYAIARRLADERTALVAAALVAFWPNLILHSAVTLSETVFIAVLLFAIWLAVAGSWRTLSLARLTAIGAVVGFATLVRPVALPLIGALFVGWLVAGVGWRAALVRTGLVTIACAAVIAPWMIRNAVVMGATVLSTNTGDNLCMSRQPGATGGFLLTEHCNALDPDLHRPESEVRHNAEGQNKAGTFVREHPTTEVRLWFSRVRFGFEDDSDGVGVAESYGEDRFLPDRLRSAVTFLANAWYAIIGITAVVSLRWWLRRRDPNASFVFAAAIAVSVVPIVAFFGDPRFHVPIDPLLAVLAAGLLTGSVRRLANG